MNPSTVERLAREAGLPRPADPRSNYAVFASLIRAEALEEAAKVCEAIGAGLARDEVSALDCAEAIRSQLARGKEVK